MSEASFLSNSAILSAFFSKVLGTTGHAFVLFTIIIGLERKENSTNVSLADEILIDSASAPVLRFTIGQGVG